MAEHEPLTYRSIIIEPANSWKEAAWVSVAIIALILAASLRVLLMPEAGKALLLESYQRLDTGLSEVERPIYQAILSSENEITSLWAVSGEWPTIDQLDEEGIPPFATDFMPGVFKKYTWNRYDRGPWVDYIGVLENELPQMPSVILRIINLHEDFHPHPHPGKDYDPQQKTAVQIWLHSESNQRYPGMRLAERDWSWVVSPDSPIVNVKNQNSTGNK